MAESHTPAVETQQSSCFVAMPFAKPIGDYYEHILAPAISQAGLFPLRADDVFKAGTVVLDMFDQIARATVVMAELTGRNPNVLYELGLAHALGKPTVLLAQSQRDIPFDLAHLRQVRYNTKEAGWEERLKTSLVSAVRETALDPLASLAIPTSPHVGAGPPDATRLIEQTVALQRATLGKLSNLAAGKYSLGSPVLLLLHDRPEPYPYWGGFLDWGGRYDVRGLPVEQHDKVRMILREAHDRIVNVFRSSGPSSDDRSRSARTEPLSEARPPARPLPEGVVRLKPRSRKKR